MEKKEGALVCVFLDSAGHQEKRSEETVQSEKDPVLVCFSFLHVKKSLCEVPTSLLLNVTSLPSLFVNDLQADSTSKGSRSCIKSGRAA